MSIDLELNRQVNICFLNVPRGSVPLDSRLAEVIYNCAFADSEGFDEAMFDAISPPILDGYNKTGFTSGSLTSHTEDGKLGVHVMVWG